MKKFIGSKITQARPMNRLEYNEYCAWQLPENENGSDEGFLVEYLDGGEAKHLDHTGYISWSPKAVFENTYHESGKMSFGDALIMLELGEKVSRLGWNGKGIFIELQRPDVKSKMTSPYIFIDTTGLQTNNPDAPKSRVPWFASQTDMLAKDWCIVE